MKTRKSLAWVLTFVTAGLMVFMLSCATTQQSNMNAGEDESAGLIGDNSTEEIDTTSDEDEVLSLLGITKEPDSTATVGSSNAVEAAAPEVETSATNTVPSASNQKPVASNTKELEQKVKALEEESQRKSREVVDLRTELVERDRRITALQKDMSRPEKASRTVASDATKDFQVKYDQALNLYRERKFRQAIQLFDELLNIGSSNSLVDNCQYWKGECFYGLSDYNQAIIEFQKIFAFENSNKFDDSQLKLGLCYMSLGDKEKAKREFQKLINNYPDSEFVGKAQNYLSGL
jgi:tol-pal system protein YbgF